MKEKLFDTFSLLKRNINDFFNEIVSNPEEIRRFSGHLTNCSRTKPLKLTWSGIKIIGGFYTGAVGFPENIHTTCTECGGSVVKKMFE